MNKMNEMHKRKMIKMLPEMTNKSINYSLGRVRRLGKVAFALTLVLSLSLSLLACGPQVEIKSKDVKSSTAPAVSTTEAAAPAQTSALSEDTARTALADPALSKPAAQEASSFTRSEEPTDYVVLRMDSGANIVLRLEPEQAPLTVANFQKLVQQGFYNGLTFHRIIPGFMIQGGDPLGLGTGGADETIKGEFSSNGVENSLSHKRGVLSMARAESPDSASSQFFICHADSLFLDGNYAAFGEVVSGLEEVDRLAQLETDSNDKPQQVPVIEEAYFVTPNN